MGLDCIVLAGGLGTRLKSVVQDKPKCLADINGQPFLYYLCKYLEKYHCRKIVFSVGYKKEMVIDYMQSVQKDLSCEIEFAMEEEPLGTGGAILNALPFTETEDVFIVNGDTFFDVNLDKLYAFQKANMADCTLALKYMEIADRYGLVSVNKDESIVSFLEKKTGAQGLINGGVYCLFKKAFESIPFPSKFSFEKEFLEQYITERNLMGFQQDGYFIDIGIPEDYQKAHEDFASMSW